MKPASYFQNFKTFVDRGIEYMRVNGRPYRVVKPQKNVVILFPMTSVCDELAKDKHRVLNQTNEGK